MAVGVDRDVIDPVTESTGYPSFLMSHPTVAPLAPASIGSGPLGQRLELVRGSSVMEPSPREAERKLPTGESQALAAAKCVRPATRRLRSPHSVRMSRAGAGSPDQEG